MSRLWQTIKAYILWTHERGTMPYDVMVSLILAFIFLAPIWINFKDRPVERTPHQTEVVVSPDGQRGFIYSVPASAITGRGGSTIETQLLRVIEPISGEVEIIRYEPVRDSKGRIISYNVWADRRY